MPGPVPKHSEDLIRRNIPDVPVETLNVDGPAPKCPPLNIPDPHPIALDWYNALAESAQSKFYEASDWQTARVCAYMLDDLLKQGRKPSAEMFKALLSAFSDLLVTEGSRRRVRLEIARASNKAKSEPETFVDKAMQGYKTMFANEGA